MLAIKTYPRVISVHIDLKERERERERVAAVINDLSTQHFDLPQEQSFLAACVCACIRMPKFSLSEH